ncbi:putative disease resistance protein RGA3 [Ziziphus jujuba]|uniref:Disease resistance protein RGA3 n=1 Tax=Ziziphus jujuba TaxID=326968 RepID=A0ABM4A152_ZIZJJ|nr:putative disease resistance protein RGA3 [Ziziphus jujuba]
MNLEERPDDHKVFTKLDLELNKLGRLPYDPLIYKHVKVIEPLLLSSDKNGEEHVQVVAIVGYRGLGETKIANYLFNDQNVPSSHFDLRIWVNVPYAFDMKSLVQGIVLYTAKKDAMVKQIESAGKRLSEYALSEICSAMHEINSLSTEQLYKENSAFLETERSAIKDSLHRLDEGELHEELQKIIDGKPLLLVLDGVWNMDTEMWLHFKNLLSNSNVVCGSRIIITTRSKLVGNIIASIKKDVYMLSNLDEYESWMQFVLSTFLSIMTEPVNSKVVEIALKIVKRCGGNPFALQIVGQQIEEVGYEYVQDLCQRSLFEEVEVDHNQNGLVTKIRIAELTQKQAILNHENDFVTKIKMPNLIHDAKRPRIRTIILPSQLQEETQGRLSSSTSKDIITNFKMLRTVNLDNRGMEVVLKFIGKLECLRYINLSQNKAIKSLPNSITKIRYLMTLKLSSCYGLKELPKDMEKLGHLKHLEIDCGDKLSDWLISLKNLVKFSLQKCKCKNLQPLSQLTSLKVLIMEDMASLKHISNKPDDHNFESSTELIKTLEELRLIELLDLEGWWEEGDTSLVLKSFPYLSKLMIEDYPKLHSMPLYPYLKECLVLKNTSLKTFT